MENFVIIPGAWESAWGYNRVCSLLEAEGHKTYPLDMPGHGQDKTPPLGMSLNSYVEKVCKEIEKIGEPVILMAHSMGGAVMTEVASKIPNSLKCIVYLASFILQDGETIYDKQEVSTQYFIDHPEFGTYSTDNWDTSLCTEEAWKRGGYNTCTDEECHESYLHISAEKLEVFETPVHRSAAFESVPRYYIHTLQDVAIPMERQRKMVEHSPCKKVYSIDACHAVYMSNPKKVADTLLDIASDCNN